jgi:hypothetical protein
MLTEDEVIAALIKHLRGTGYRVDQYCLTTEHGIDIDAVNKRTGQRLLIECKGGTSSKNHTNRYGRPFTRNQAKCHVAVAFYCAARLRKEYAGAQIGLAFPDDEIHPRLIDDIADSIEDLGISVYFVNNKKTVRHI